MQKLLILLVAVFAGGCATSNSNYAPPTEVKLENTKSVNKPFDEVWDRLVKDLSSDFFVINNIDKNSRLINLSFSSSRPSEFVNCGRTKRTFSNMRGQQDYDYDTADSATFTLTDQRGLLYHVARTTRLEGRVNIYVAPEGGGTNVTVNAKYVLAITAATSAVDGRPLGAPTSTIDFSTKSGSSPTSDGVACFARGNVEAKILNFAG